MGEEFLDLVANNENVAGIKESSGDVSRIHLLANSYPQIELVAGAEDQVLEFFVWGANSWVTPMGNFIAEETVAFYNLCVRDQNFVKARIAPYKYPRAIEFVSELPKTQTGKLQRFKLRI